jgi:transcriptional regulator with XRE-family HTH domain
MQTLMRVVFVQNFPGLGRQIKALRQASDKDWTELAAIAGISVAHWSRIENEKVKDLPIATLRGIERALGADLGVRFDDAQD